MYNLIKELRAQNFNLQTRIGDIENQLDKKALDLSIRDEQIKGLKQAREMEKLQFQVKEQ
jgi:hypothetical protein